MQARGMLQNQIPVWMLANVMMISCTKVRVRCAIYEGDDSAIDIDSIIIKIWKRRALFNEKISPYHNKPSDSIAMVVILVMLVLVSQYHDLYFDYQLNCHSV